MPESLDTSLTPPPHVAAALELAASGIKVFFLPAGAKGGGRGMTSATSDPASILLQAQEEPTWTNVAAVPGPRFVVVDLDTYKATPAISAFLVATNDDAPTLEAVTAQGGRHIWYRCPEDLQGKITAHTGTGPLLGIDLRGTGGYVVVPPSQYTPNEAEAAKGKRPGRYAWERAFREGAIQDLSDAARAVIEAVLPSVGPSEGAPTLGNTEAGPWVPPRALDPHQSKHFAECVDREVSRVLAGFRERVADAGSRHDALISASNRLGAYRWGLTHDHAERIKASLVAAAEGSKGAERAVHDGWENAAPGPVRWADRDGDPMVVEFPSGNSSFVRAPEGGYYRRSPTIAASECKRFYPYIWKPPQKGPKGIGYFAKFFGAGGDRLEYTYNPAMVGFRRAGRTGTLTVNVVRAAPVEPVFHAECDEWLRLLAGKRYDLLEQWIAGLGRLDEAAACPVVWGASGAGKQMLAVAAGLQFGTMPFDFEKAAGRFNLQQVYQPVTWQDEAVRDATDTNLARRMIANTTHSVEGKGMPTADLLGAIRLIATAQHVDPFKFDANLVNSDEVSDTETQRAVWHRMLVVPVSEDPALWLAEKGGRTYTHDWVGSPRDPGRLVQHFRHLITTVQVESVGAGRFIAEDPDWTVWMTKAVANTGKEKRLLGWILASMESWHVRAASGGRTVGSLLSPALVWSDAPRGVWVHAPTLLRAWAPFTGTDRKPWYPDTVSETLDNLSEKSMGDAGRRVGRRQFPRSHPLGRVRGHFVSFDTLAASDRFTGPEVADLFQAALGTSNPQGGQTP